MDQPVIRQDVVYGDAGNRPLKLDIYAPKRGANGTAVLMVHGGGWSRGSKDMLAPHANALSEQGFVAIASEYRLTGEAKFPAQIHDVKRAIRWVRAHARDLGVNPARLCLEGHSAGAHLVLLAAAADDPRLDPPEGHGKMSAAVSAVAAVYPPVLFYLGDARPSGGLQARALPGADASEESASLASPLLHVTSRHPPTMLLHGDIDKIVPVSTSYRYAQKLREAGAKVDLHIFAGFPHGFGNHEQFRPIMMTMIGDFFRRHVAEPEAFEFGPSNFQLTAVERR